MDRRDILLKHQEYGELVTAVSSVATVNKLMKANHLWGTKLTDELDSCVELLDALLAQMYSTLERE